MSFTEADNKAINTIRVLAADTVFKGNSGHPGTLPSVSTRGHSFTSHVITHSSLRLVSLFFSHDSQVIVLYIFFVK
jgi:transketolase